MGLERPATRGSLAGGAQSSALGGMKAGRSTAGTSPGPYHLCGCPSVFNFGEEEGVAGDGGAGVGAGAAGDE